VLLIGAYIATTIFAFVGLLPIYCLAVWITFPLAYGNVERVLTAQERKVFVIGIKQTSLLHLVFGVTLTLTLIVATLLH
jgi:1,4-dihydroxy-2-naphthoate octaprenyltransferase